MKCPWCDDPYEAYYGRHHPNNCSFRSREMYLQLKGSELQPPDADIAQVTSIKKATERAIPAEQGGKS